MFSVLKLSWALFVGIGLIMLGNGLQTSLLGLRASMEGFSTAATGIIMSSFYLGFLSGSKFTPRIVGNVGHIRVFAAWSSMASVSILMHGLFVEPVFWGFMRFVTGFCYAGLYVVAESWLNDRADNKTRGQLLSVYMITQYVGLSGGQLLLNLAAPTELYLFVLTSAMISMALVPISLTTNAVQPPMVQESLKLRELIKISPLGVMTCFAAGITTGALLGMGVVFAKKVGLGLGETSIFMAVLIVGAVVFQFPLGRVSDFFDRRKVLAVANFGALGVLLAAFYSLDRGTQWLLPMIFVVGGVTMPLYALGVAYTNDELRPAQMVAASSSLVLVFGLGASVGPVGVGAAMGWLGAEGFFLSIAIIHLMVGVFALAQIAVRRARDPDEQTRFQAVASTMALKLRQRIRKRPK